MKNQDPLTGKGIRGEVRKPSFAIWHLKQPYPTQIFHDQITPSKRMQI